MDLVTTQKIRHYSPPYWWRLIATACCFLFFGLGGLCLRLLVFPALHLLPGNKQIKRQRVRMVVSRTFSLFCRFMQGSGVLTYTIEGAERLGQPGQMVIANHPSLIDVVLLIAQIRDANCIVKQSLWNNPCMRGPIQSAQYISNNGSMEMVDEATEILQQGQTLIIFPEGTRTTPGQIPFFHRGAAAIAIRGAKVVTPVTITVSPSTLTKAQPWYRIPPRRAHFHISVGQDIHPAQFLESAAPPMASRRLNEYLHQHYIKELTKHEQYNNRN